jgi:hypothetical protein
MKPEIMPTQARLAFPVRRAYWTVVVILLLLTLAGCLTSYAAGPPETDQNIPSAVGQSLPTLTPSANLAASPSGVTVVPNTSIRAFQQITPTVESTPTPEPTNTPVPTDTPKPTDTPVPTATATPVPTNTPQPSAIEATLAPFQAYAWMDNYYPAPGSVVTVHGSLERFGRPVCGANMGATFRYTCGTDYCSAFTGLDGKALCSRNIGCALPGYWVIVDVVFTFEDQQYYARTGFLVDP